MGAELSDGFSELGRSFDQPRRYYYSQGGSGGRSGDFRGGEMAQLGGPNPRRSMALPEYMVNAYNQVAEREGARRMEMLSSKSVSFGGKTMRFGFRVFGQRPRDGFAVFLGLHGGGGTSREVNDQQFANHQKLYELPPGSLWIAPRAPEDAWNMWHLPYMDSLLEELIKGLVLSGLGDPNRIYLTGYSAGGDGVYKLGPRMADRFAGAAMMAGHPNGASPLSLRNLPFVVMVGAQDSGYQRNQKAREFVEALDGLQREDPQGYEHFGRLPPTGHWMNLQDQVAFPWLAAKTRVPLPRKIVWKQCDDVPKLSFYWLAVPQSSAKKGSLVSAVISGQNNIEIFTSDVPEVIVHLNDALVDLSQNVRIFFNGTLALDALVRRDPATIEATAAQFCDPYFVFAARVSVSANARASPQSQFASPSPQDPLKQTQWTRSPAPSQGFFNPYADEYGYGYRSPYGNTFSSEYGNEFGGGYGARYGTYAQPATPSDYGYQPQRNTRSSSQPYGYRGSYGSGFGNFL